MMAPGSTQHGSALAGVKANPSGGPTASLDTGCEYYLGAAIREPTGNNITTSQVPTKSGEPRHKEHLRQGSWAHETIINPVSDYDEFDADILLHLENNPDWNIICLVGGKHSAIGHAIVVSRGEAYGLVR
jgi:Second Messenger Oligonucleotide or Dinucleotide Synthetase domain